MKNIYIIYVLCATWSISAQETNMRFDWHTELKFQDIFISENFDTIWLGPDANELPKSGYLYILPDGYIGDQYASISIAYYGNMRIRYINVILPIDEKNKKIISFQKDQKIYDLFIKDNFLPYKITEQDLDTYNVGQVVEITLEDDLYKEVISTVLLDMGLIHPYLKGYTSFKEWNIYILI